MKPLIPLALLSRVLLLVYRSLFENRGKEEQQ